MIDRKLDALNEKEDTLTKGREELEVQGQQLGEREKGIDRLHAETASRLEKVAGLTQQEAKAQLVAAMSEAAKSEAAAKIREVREEATRTADREARKIVALTVQRVAAEQTTEIAVSTVTLPNDDMKGRIIGREGRNIRAFETATGVDVIIDDTPDTVVVSCFDPVRREVARRALEQLIQDGRIHPGRIEEVVGKAQKELEEQLVEIGEEAAYELNIHGLHPELIKLVGRMKYRTSYGQNLLAHTKEVAWIAGMLAAELKLDVALVKRGALLHDVGKVLTHTHEGTHVELGVEMATRHGEDPLVINCIAAHHDDVPHETTESVIVQAADSASGARPGARREAFDTYVKRLTSLEKIATSFRGVEKAFAIQAGREVRIVVLPDQVDDQAALDISEQVARRVESELQYPGQIKVVVVRETRAVDFAR
jgi:ribonuclease Y